MVHIRTHWVHIKSLGRTQLALGDLRVTRGYATKDGRLTRKREIHDNHPLSGGNVPDYAGGDEPLHKPIVRWKTTSAKSYRVANVRFAGGPKSIHYAPGHRASMPELAPLSVDVDA